MEKTWAFQDAKARLSEVMREAEDGAQHITLRGEEKVVVISAREYRKLKGIGGKKGAGMSLYDALRSCPYELKIPPRSRERGREIKL
ncbi:MAG TPA: type II toxin-antitoxin system Phd/YefM family antitoxin [Rhizomicrobium sp.]|nr:type II toxin-antitoxin system Phd/YefM family antitoxin [Rhizomicrobium sp.]